MEYKVIDYRSTKTLNNRLPNDTIFDYLGIYPDSKSKEADLDFKFKYLCNSEDI
jgi:hypothetical protein